MKLNLAHLHFSSLACSRFVQPLLYYFKHISCFCSYQKSKLILYFPETFNQGINGVVHVEFGLFKKEIDKLVPNESYYFHLSGEKKKKNRKGTFQPLNWTLAIVQCHGCRQGVQNWILSEHSVEWFCPQLPDIPLYVLLLGEQSASHGPLLQTFMQYSALNPSVQGFVRRDL